VTKSPESAMTPDGTSGSPTAEQLCETALRLFALKGYASTSVNEIVEAAGVTKPMLYYYYGSKERLARRIVIEPAEALAEELEAIEHSDRTAVEKEIAWMRAQLAFCRETPDRARFVFALYFGPLGADLAEAVGRIGERSKQIIRRIVVQRPDLAGWTDARLDDYVRAIQGQMLSTIIDMLYTCEPTSLHDEPLDDLARRLILDLDAGYVGPQRYDAIPSSHS
jgi:AcrR family transcriptional regulator